MRHLFQLVLVAFLLSFSLSRGAESPAKPVTLSGPDALDKTIQTLAEDLTNQLRAADEKARKVASPGDGLSITIFGVAGILGGVLLLSKVLLPLMANRLTSRDTAWAPAAETRGSNENEEDFSKLVKDFGSRQKSGGSAQPEPGGTQMASAFRSTELKPSQQLAGESRRSNLDLVTRVRKVFSRLSRATSQDSRKQGMTNLLEAVRLLREGLETPSMHSARQLASALEELLGEVTNKPERATTSVLRTIAGAIDLLPGLCGPGIRSDLTSSPVVRLLGVDDDAISRYALTCALRQHFPRPDLAVNGEEALHLGETRPYDVIFVDIEMPAMDGFELCSRIHSTTLNQATPIVFVTGHDDLNSRAKSLVSGGAEFLGKPFLAYELTVKALTLVLKRRLQGEKKPASPPVRAVATQPAVNA